VRGQNVITGYENNQRAPKYTTVIQYANILNVPYMTLMSDEIEKPAISDGRGEFDDVLRNMLKSLRPEEIPQVLAFVEGLKAARKD
jgi:hypothetical protein